MATIREALSEAYEAAQGTEEAAEAPSTEAVAPDSPPPTEASPALEAEAPTEAPQPKARDDSGRFTRTPKPRPEVAKAAAVKPTAPAPAAQPPSVTQAPEAPKPAESLRAPQSWTPAEREFFGKLPQEAQRAILRQDTEVQKVMRESAPARRFHEDFNRLTAPYAPLLAGTQPLQAIGSMLQTVATLATGSAPQKAGLLANLIRSYGVDINALAQALDGQPAQPGQQAAPVDAHAIYQQVRQQLMSDFSRQAQAQQARAADAEVAEFAKNHEFLDDVADDMAALIDAANRRGIALGYEEAYARACRAHPDVSKVIAQREAAAAATAAQAATQRARIASSSVRTQPASPPNGTDKRSLRDTLESVAAQMAGR